MSYAFPPEDALLIKAMQVLREHDDAVAAIQEGLADMEAGRLRPLRDLDAELRTKHSIPRSG